VSATGFGTWEMQAGDPASFAFRLSFLPNPHGADDRASDDVRESWGSFTIWARGENLCGHVEQGEVLDSAHWYLLPLMEWLADSWDPLLHEERLPLQNAGASAAESLSKTRMPPVSLKQVDEFAWLDAWSDWWARHSVRSAREGGLFPDLYLRRYRDTLEVSTGAEPLPGIPAEFAFLAPNRTYYTDLRNAAEVTCQVLAAAAQELRRKLPQSQRVLTLVEKIASLASPARRPSRMAWLADLGDKYSQVARAIDDALSSVDTRIRESITSTRGSSSLVVAESAYARLLYGAVSPATNLSDVMLLTAKIVDNYVDDATPWLSALDLPLDAAEISQLSPGEQGSRLGESACELLCGDSTGWIDVESVLSRLDVAVSEIELSDIDIRAVSIFGPTQRPHVFRNARTRWGQSSAVNRFTIAHELCHLILDRDYGDELAVATGPWAPLAIEQRANAFAAAFLMPTWLLRDALADTTAHADDPDAIRFVSTKLRVSVSSLIDRLYNLGEITFEERIQLRPVQLPESGNE
jgi:Zn-dependent peptidase ImmA (M78 family)